MNGDRVLCPPLLTIGHSDRPLDEFVGVLLRFGVDVLVDVRSHPYSRRYPQFRQRELVAGVTTTGITYVWHGRALGPRREEPELRAEDGRVDYDRIAATPEFRAALARVLRIAREGRRIALCCAEGDPLDCHRAVLVGRRLRSSVQLGHVLRNGTLEDQEAFERRLLARAGLADDGLFADRAERVEEAYDRVGRRIAWRP